MSNDNDISIALFQFLSGATTITDLLADGEEGVWEDQAGENARRPFLIYSEVSGVPNYSLGEGELYRAFIYQVKAVVDGDDAKPAAVVRDAVEAVLSDGALSIPGRKLLVTDKISNIRLTETVASTRYNHRGGLYRIWVEDE